MSYWPILCWLCLCACAAPSARPTDPAPLRVVSYNLRFDNPDDGPNRWSARRAQVAGLLEYHAADLIGTQEALHHQLTELEGLLDGFGWLGVGRDDGQQAGEHSAIFFRRSRLEVLEEGTFWLSPTPESPSLGWDAAIVRVCTWAQLRDRATGQTFYHFNAHFDHVGQQARTESARLIRTRVQQIAGTQPVLITGDWNAEPGAEPYRTMVADSVFRDAYHHANAGHYGAEGTFNAFRFDQPPSRRIDYVFVSHHWKVRSHAILTDSYDQKYPSDHLPVVAEVVLALP